MSGGRQAPRPRRVLVCGSRSWTDVGPIRRELADAWDELSGLDGPPVLVHGACPRGADRIADLLWRQWGGPVEPHPADWDGPHGKGAGFARNHDMIALGADRVLGFVRDHSPGSSDTLAEAHAAHLDVREHHSTSEPAAQPDRAPRAQALVAEPGDRRDRGLFELPRAAPAAAPTIPAPRPAPEADTPPPATPDVWRISERGVVAFPDYSPDTCSGDHGLCGVCVGARCENAPEPDHLEHDDTEHEHPQEHDDEEPEA